MQDSSRQTCSIFERSQKPLSASQQLSVCLSVSHRNTHEHSHKHTHALNSWAPESKGFVIPLWTAALSWLHSAIQQAKWCVLLFREAQTTIDSLQKAILISFKKKYCFAFFPISTVLLLIIFLLVGPGTEAWMSWHRFFQNKQVKWWMECSHGGRFANTHIRNAYYAIWLHVWRRIIISSNS